MRGASVLAAAVTLLAADTFEVFPADQTCACVRLLTSHRFLRAEERRVGERIVQVFLNKTTGKEEFRVSIGTVFDTEELKLWRYGLAVARDLNRDGVEDFSWYGGDDTNHHHFLFLSSPAGYRKIEINATFARKWHRLTGQRVDFHSVGDTVFLRNIVVEHAAEGLSLVAEMGTTLPAPSARQPRRLRAYEPEFIIAR